MQSAAERLTARRRDAPRPADTGLRAPLVAAIACLHLVGLFALDRLDRLRPPEAAGAAVEIPVEVVSEPPPDSKPTGPDTPAEQTAAPPQAERPAKPAPEPPRGVVLEPPRETDLPQQARARGETQTEAEPSGPQKTQEAPFGALAALDEAAETPKGPIFLSPQALTGTRNTSAAPKTGNDNYRALVLRKVVEAMVDPERPRPKAVALVSFAVDSGGALVSVELAQPSGHADLDAEAIGMVRRAAPFPPPPPNADRRFGAFIEFGE